MKQLYTHKQGLKSKRPFSIKTGHKVILLKFNSDSNLVLHDIKEPLYVTSRLVFNLSAFPTNHRSFLLITSHKMQMKILLGGGNTKISLLVLEHLRGPNWKRL